MRGPGGAGEESAGEGGAGEESAGEEEAASEEGVFAEMVAEEAATGNGALGPFPSPGSAGPTDSFSSSCSMGEYGLAEKVSRVKYFRGK